MYIHLKNTLLVISKKQTYRDQSCTGANAVWQFIVPAIVLIDSKKNRNQNNVNNQIINYFNLCCLVFVFLFLNKLKFTSWFQCGL